MGWNHGIYVKMCISSKLRYDQLQDTSLFYIPLRKEKFAAKINFHCQISSIVKCISIWGMYPSFRDVKMWGKDDGKEEKEKKGKGEIVRKRKLSFYD